MIRRTFLPLLAALPFSTALGAESDFVHYPPAGTAKGKHIVLLAGDDEYRSEEAMPLLGKILSQHHGFECTVLFSVDEEGAISPEAQASLTHPEALDKADAIVMLLRFRRWNEAALAKFEAAVNRGIPIIALRTSTHAFSGIPKESKYVTWNWNNAGGFGKKVLGETWVSHWGHHKVEATRGIVESANAAHPILRGVEGVFGTSDVYEAAPPADATILMRGQVLAGMEFGSPPKVKRKARADKQEQDLNDPMMPIAWTRELVNDAGRTNRIFCTTMGAATDLLSEGLRRMIVNSVYWGFSMDVPAKAEVAPVGEFAPTNYGFKGHQTGVKPEAHALK